MRFKQLTTSNNVASPSEPPQPLDPDEPTSRILLYPTPTTTTANHST